VGLAFLFYIILHCSYIFRSVVAGQSRSDLLEICPCAGTTLVLQLLKMLGMPRPTMKPIVFGCCEAFPDKCRDVFSVSGLALLVVSLRDCLPFP